MNGQASVIFNYTIVTANILAPVFQSDLICCWSVWRYIIIIRYTCNSYNIIIKYNSTHRLALDGYGIFFVFPIPYHPLSCSLFIYLMPENADWIHILYIQP